MSILDKLAKEAPEGRGVSQLTATDLKEIAQARKAGYSWEQIWKVLGKYNSATALYAAFYRDTEADNQAK